MDGSTPVNAYGNPVATINYTAANTNAQGYTLILEGSVGAGTRVRISNANPRIAATGSPARDFGISNALDYDRIAGKVTFGDTYARSTWVWCNITPYATPGDAPLQNYSKVETLPSSLSNDVTLIATGFSNGPPAFAQTGSPYLTWPGAAEMNPADLATWSADTNYTGWCNRQFVYSRGGLEHFFPISATCKVINTKYSTTYEGNCVMCRSSIPATPAIHVMGGVFKIKRAMFVP